MGVNDRPEPIAGSQKVGDGRFPGVGSVPKNREEGAEGEEGYLGILYVSTVPFR